MFAAGIDMTIEGDLGTTHTTLRGWKEGHYFLVDAPSGAWRNIAGSDTVCRIDHEGRYYGFAAFCLALLPELNILAFAWPDDIMENDRRTASRFDITMPVTIYRINGEKQIGHNEGVVTDLSRGGCRLICERVYQNGDKVFLTGHLPLGEETGAVEAFVRRPLDHKGKGNAYGLQFALLENDPGMTAFFERMERYHDRDHHVDDKAIIRGEALPVGERCLVQTTTTERVITHMRGYRSTKYVLLETPVKNQKPHVVPAGQYYGVKFFQAGKVFSFESALLKQYMKPPILLWVFKFPEEINEVSLRTSHRIKTFIGGETIKPDGKRGEGAFVDLSAGGGLFVVEEGAYEVGEKLLVDLSLSPTKKVTGLSCEVKSVAHRGGKASLGLSFLDQEGEAYVEVYAFYTACANHTVLS